MAKLILGLVLSWACLAQAKSLQLELYAQTSLDSRLDFQKEKVGGLSGIFWDGKRLAAISDDRGKYGPPRFYDLTMKLIPGKVDLSVSKVHHFKDYPQDWIMDLEAIVSLPNGDIIASTEGDNNHKPRAMPHVFVTSNEGVFKYDIPLPDKFLPEETGLQKKGIENNRAFEAVTTTPDGANLYIMNEYPILADQGDDDKNYWIRLVSFKKDKDNYKVSGEYAYSLSRLPNTSSGVEVYRGISEMLYQSENKFIVLERGVRLTKGGINYTGGLYLADMTGAKDISAVKSLADGKSAGMKKQLLVDLEDVLKNRKMENYEGLAWGPTLPDGRKSLLVIADSNFSSKEKTVLLVFAVKEVE